MGEDARHETGRVRVSGGVWGRHLGLTPSSRRCAGSQVKGRPPGGTRKEVVCKLTTRETIPGDGQG